MTQTDLPAATDRVFAIRAGGMLRSGIVVTLVLLLGAFLSIIWTPQGFEPAGARLAAPGLAHPLGTDAAGRDVLSLTMRGALTSFVVAAVGTAIAFFVGTLFGLLTSMPGRWSMRIRGGTHAFFAAIPALVVAGVLAARLGPGALNAMLAIGVAGIPVFVRLIHATVDGLRSNGGVSAARLAGSGWGDAIRMHVVPRLAAELTVRFTGFMAVAVVLEGALAYVGFGAQPGGASLGLMLREAQNYLSFEPQLAIAPGVVMSLVSLGLMLISDGLRRDLALPAREQLDAAA